MSYTGDMAIHEGIGERNKRIAELEAKNAKLQEGLRELGCDVIRAETSGTLSTTREHLLSARSRINALLGKDGAE